MARYYLALDLKDDESLIKQYEAHHKMVWPEVLQSIRDGGIQAMEIYRVGNRLFMIMTTDETFSFEKKSVSDRNNRKVQEWEKLMWKYQQALPCAKQGEKWLLMEKYLN